MALVTPGEPRIGRPTDVYSVAWTTLTRDEADRGLRVTAEPVPTP
jgi:hypothetical protein